MKTIGIVLVAVTGVPLGILGAISFFILFGMMLGDIAKSIKDTIQQRSYFDIFCLVWAVLFGVGIVLMHLGD